MVGLGWAYLGNCARRTTLFEVWIWLGVAIACAATLEWPTVPTHGVPSPWRWCVATAASSPFVALLGAKRPQHRAWQFVVLTLWIVLSLPAWEGMVYGAGRLAIDPLRTSVCYVLLGLSGLNWLGTRFWWAALCGASGQFCLYAPFLVPTGWGGGFWAVESVPIPLALWALGLVSTCVEVRRMRRLQANVLSSPFGHYTRVWRNWRDCYGVIWAFRLMERMHTAGESSRWPTELVWSGFIPRAGFEGSDDGGWETALRGLLRRFVDESFLVP